MKRSNQACLESIFFILLTIFLASCAAPTESDKSGLRPAQAHIRHPGIITLPRVFEPVWYREEKRKSLIKAYRASGKLTISDKKIEFGSNDVSFDIDIEDINSIEWGQLPRDFYNNWSIIRYGDPERVIGFKDGNKLGMGTDTDFILSTLKYAAEVIRGHSPTTGSPFASGWIDIGMGGLMASDAGNLIIGLNLYNKSDTDIWIKVTFLKPDLSTACTVIKKTGAKNSSVFECPQETIIGDQYYLIYHSVFLDNDLTELVEKSGTRMSFSREGIEMFRKAQESL